MTIGVVAIISTIIGAVLTGTAKFQSSAYSKSQLEIFRRGMIQAANSRAAWAVTIAHNPVSMSCLTAPGSPCTDAGGNPLSDQPFALYGGDGSLVYDGTDDSAGVTTTGTFCRSYSPDGETANCPYHYKLTWSPVCQSGSCLHPLLKITATLSLESRAPANVTSVSPTTYSDIVYYQPLMAACGSANGVPTASAPVSNLCYTGTASVVSGSGPWTWTCTDSGGAIGCQAPLPAGVCGPANGTVAFSQPSAGLCASGTASAVAGPVTGPWTWTCDGTSCSTTPVVGSARCGWSSGTYYTSPPPSGPNLCRVGVASAVGGPGPWTWTCTFGASVVSCGTSPPCSSVASCGGTFSFTGWAPCGDEGYMPGCVHPGGCWQEWPTPTGGCNFGARYSADAACTPSMAIIGPGDWAKITPDGGGNCVVYCCPPP